MNKKENFYNKFKSSMPPHLTPEEQEEWLEETTRQEREIDRRKKEGLYDNPSESKLKKQKRKTKKQKYNSDSSACLYYY